MEFLKVEFLKIEDRGLGPAAIFYNNLGDREFALLEPYLRTRIENLKNDGRDVSEEEWALAVMAQ